MVVVEVVVVITNCSNSGSISSSDYQTTSGSGRSVSKPSIPMEHNYTTNQPCSHY